jgi:hypothetical protein
MEPILLNVRRALLRSAAEDDPTALPCYGTDGRAPHSAEVPGGHAQATLLASVESSLAAACFHGDAWAFDQLVLLLRQLVPDAAQLRKRL